MTNKRTISLKESHVLSHRVSLSDQDYAAACKYYFKTQALLDLPVGRKDITSKLSIKGNGIVSARCTFNESGIFAGGEEIRWFLKSQSGIVDVELLCSDGDYLQKGRECVNLIGDPHAVLLWERILVNFLQRMSGIATVSRDIVKIGSEIAPNVLICSTRKTFMGPMDKKAALLGGAGTHRVYLSDAVLLKENHLITSALDLNSILSSVLKPGIDVAFFEFEAESMNQAISMAKVLNELIRARQISKPVGILLDNFSPPLIQSTLNKARDEGLYENLFWEASGGINHENISAYLKTGVDIISLGALTNHSKHLDISMRVSSRV